MGNKIFISYRRDDARAEALSIYQRLQRTFSKNQLFFDVDSIQRGRDFRQAIDQSISDCKVLLAVIGPRWVDARDDSGARRIDCEDDYVRYEIATALAQNIRVIPVLVGGASLPRSNELPEALRALRYLQTAVIGHQNFFHDMNGLVGDLRNLVSVERSLLWVAAIPIAIIGAAAVWTLSRYAIERDGSDLRMETQGVAQALTLVSKVQPTVDNEPVYCDTASLTLVLSHNGGGKRPVLVNAISFRAEPVQPPPAPRSLNCEIDSLETRPYGIGLRDTYIFDVLGSKPVARYIESAQAGAARSVNAENILQIQGQERFVSLKPEEEQVAWRVFVNLKTSGLYQVWFAAAYDVGGARTSATRRLLLASGGGQ